MKKLTEMTQALQHYGFPCLVYVTENPYQEDNEITIADNVHIQVPSMGDGPYILWHRKDGVSRLVVQTTDASKLAQQLYKAAIGA